MARHFPRVSLLSAQRIRPPLPFVYAKRLQRMGLRILQRGCLCDSIWYVLSLHLRNPTIVLNCLLFFALGESTITARTTISFAINALIIVSTIYAQDFRDEIGDKRMGRRTIPILWPEGSRIGIFMVLAVWSIGLAWACDLGPFFSVPFCTLATFVGLRFFRKRTAEADQRSYRYYNVRPVGSHKRYRFRLNIPSLLQIWLAAAQVVHIPVITAALSQL